MFLVLGGVSGSVLITGEAIVTFTGSPITEYPSTGSSAGTSLSGAGDFSGDGFSDLLIGSSGDPTERIGAGSAQVIFGRAY